MGPGGVVPAVILVEPREAGNAGSVARAMANFNLSRLVLAGPTELPAHQDFVAARREGRAILERASRAADLRQALAPFHLAIAVTGRKGKHRPADLGPGGLAGFLSTLPAESDVALVFGRESDGLRSDEILLCGRRLAIPASPDAPSLNLAQAAGIVAFAWYQGAATARSRGVDRGAPGPGGSHSDLPARIEDREALFSSLESSLLSIGFLEGDRRADTMATLRRIIGRAGLSEREVSLLRGLARKIGGATLPR